MPAEGRMVFIILFALQYHCLSLYCPTGWQSTAGGLNGCSYTSGGRVLSFEMSKQATFTIKSCSFIGCTTNLQGGAIYLTGDKTTIEVTSATFTSCQATGKTTSRGGACAVFVHAVLVVRSSKFDDCSGSDGGCFYCYIGTCVILASDFSRCKASNQNGGIFYVSSSGNVVNMSDSSVTGCFASYGGLMNCVDKSASINIENVTYKSCEQGQSGGVLYGSGVFSVVNLSTYDTVVKSYGGLIYSTSSVSKFVLSHVECHNCSCGSSNGGAVYMESVVSIVMNDCKFLECTASKGAGGVMYCKTCPVSIWDCEFHNAIGTSGSALELFGGTFSCYRCTFRYCETTGSSTLTAGIGGTLSLASSGLKGDDVVIEESVFVCNIGSSSCSGISVHVYRPANVRCANNVFHFDKRYAKNANFYVNIDSYTATFTNCTFCAETEDSLNGPDHLTFGGTGGSIVFYGKNYFTGSQSKGVSSSIIVTNSEFESDSCPCGCSGAVSTADPPACAPPYSRRQNR